VIARKEYSRRLCGHELAHAVRLDIGAAKSLLLGAPDEFKVLAEGAPPGKFSRCFLLCTS
jgi:hypothetical protein